MTNHDIFTDMLNVFIAKVQSDAIPPEGKAAGKCIATTLAVYIFTTEVARRTTATEGGQPVDVQQPLEAFMAGIFEMFDTSADLLNTVEEFAQMMGFLPKGGKV